MSEVLNLEWLPDGRVINQTNMDPGIARVTGHDRFWIGADLGQANDYSAVSVIRDTQLPILDNGMLKLGQRRRTVVFADQFRGVSYVDVVDYLIRLRAAKEWCHRNRLVIDGSSIGRVVSDMLFEQNVEHTAVQMTAGQEWSKKGRYVNAGKTLLVETTAVMFASGDLKFADDLALREKLEEDFASFQIKTTAAGNQVISQSRSAAGHGDLAISLIVAAFASQHVNTGRIEVRTLKGWC